MICRCPFARLAIAVVALTVLILSLAWTRKWFESDCVVLKALAQVLQTYFRCARWFTSLYLPVTSFSLPTDVLRAMKPPFHAWYRD